MEFDLENPLTNSHDFHSEIVPSLFHLESDHMPSELYLKSLKAGDFDISVRREAISSILQLSCGYDPFLSYLAINYLDRFLSIQGLTQPKPWVVRLLAVSCVSLAAKMNKTAFSHTDFPGDGGFIFDSQTIQRMEVLILGVLKWRMRSITPFCFITFFISLFKLKDSPLIQALKARAMEIIFKAQNDVELLPFKPSIIAASVLLSVAHELFPLQFPCFIKSICYCSNVNKENLLQCYNAMQDIAMDGYESLLDTVSSSDTPVNVLDGHFLSLESEKTNGSSTVTATSSAPRAERDAKRRKISGYCNDQTAQLSQTPQQC